ncbi:hypothetical protein C9374_010478 [Naegleria lovaniensis]|uniref:F-box domain-containing protein n=1 Tax=Naegleria lovaniensis TaxID=51637 RepID=A0AA88KFS1_NAELO|nr:uncharacterized protein C9374_010478 [Naegleria lovaniensis]KAG2374734.1 hypothetical protein C9374_010478 [Naegleria lovaniensis]
MIQTDIAKTSELCKSVEVVLLSGKADIFGHLNHITIPEIWANIFSFLSFVDFLKVARVCKLWKQASELPFALSSMDLSPNKMNFKYLSRLEVISKYFKEKFNTLSVDYSSLDFITQHLIRHQRPKRLLNFDKSYSVDLNINPDIRTTTLNLILGRGGVLSCDLQIAEPKDNFDPKYFQSLELFPNLKYLSLSLESFASTTSLSQHLPAGLEFLEVEVRVSNYEEHEKTLQTMNPNIICALNDR